MFFIITFIPFNNFKIFLLNKLPNVIIDKKSKIGLGVFFCGKKINTIQSKIGNFNYIDCIDFKISNSKILNNNIFINLHRLNIGNKSIIGSYNIICCLRNCNKIYIKMNKSQISTNFRLNLTNNLYLGERVILGGLNTKIIGQKNKNVKKNTTLYKNIFVGSNVTIKNGIKINKDIIIGANTLVDENIYESGKYFSKNLEVF